MKAEPFTLEVIDDETAKVLRHMRPQDRVKRGLAMGEFAREVIAARVREEHPDWCANQIIRETARRFAGD